MSEHESPDEGPFPDSPAEQTGFGPRWARFIAAVFLASLVVAVLVWWRPWVSVSPACVDDESHVIDDEAGLCYSVPRDWVRDDTVGSEDGGFSSAITSPNEAAWVAVGPVEDSVAETGVEEASRQVVAFFGEISPDAPGIESGTGSIEGHDSATATVEVAPFWFRVTAVDLGGRVVAMTGSSLNGEPGLIEVVEQVHGSLGVQ